MNEYKTKSYAAAAAKTASVGSCMIAFAASKPFIKGSISLLLPKYDLE
jgi:hypothetical protein